LFAKSVIAIFFLVIIVAMHRVQVFQGFYRSGKTGKKIREFEWSGKSQGKVRGKYFLEKSGKMKNWCHQMSDFLD